MIIILKCPYIMKIKIKRFKRGTLINMNKSLKRIREKGAYLLELSEGS
jgi:hypothetical protein